MNILFIDNDKELTEKLYHDFITYFSLYKDKFVIKIINNDFNNIPLNNINIVFIDIDLKICSGIDIAKKITKISPTSKIIYFTYREDLVFDALDTNIFQFIRKGKYKLDINTVFRKLEKYIKEDRRIIDYNGRQIIIDINDIQYIVSIGRNITIHCNNNEYTLKSSIKEILELLNSSSLVQIQRTLIINMNMINKITKTKILTNDNHSYIIGRKYSDNLIYQYEKYLFKW